MAGLAISGLAAVPRTAMADPLFVGPFPSFATGNEPFSVAIGDLNGDGRPDLATANYFHTVSVLLGNGDGTFGAKTDYSTGAIYPYSVAIGDLNSDGRPDLAVAGLGFCRASVLLGNGGGAFGAITSYGTGYSSYSVGIGDVNGDGRPDLATANADGSTVSVLLGNGDGTFGANSDFVTGDSPRSIVMGDMNGDDKLDLATANLNSNNVSVLLGDGNGTFSGHSDYATGSLPRWLAIGDLNGDGRPDLAVATYIFGSNTVSVLLGNGDGTLGVKSDYATGNSPVSVAIGDLNGDGRPDLAVANSGASSASVLIGSGDGAFGAKNDHTTGSSPTSVAIGDLNGDGNRDVAVANGGANTVSVLINTGGGVTATLLSNFEGGWTTEGIEVRWKFGEPGSFSGAELDRCNDASGPWSHVIGERRDLGETAVLLDRSVEPDQAYYYRLVVTQRDGSVMIFGPLVVTAGGSLNRFELVAVAPNPTQGVARIDFKVAHEARVRLSVLDVLGRRVAQLADAVYRPGRYQAVWDGRNDRGGAPPAGLYFVRYEWPGQHSVRRLLLVH
jgi:hypothetical protein